MNNAWTELDLGVLKENIHALRAVLSAGTEIVFVVKSDAYGHGTATVARAAWAFGVKWFSVAHVSEALELRQVLPEAKILIVGVMNPVDVHVATEHDFLPVVVSEAHARALAAASPAGKALRCHVKVDTGMGRLGFAWEEASRLIPALARGGGLDICGICTHFASSDNPRGVFTEIQAERFRKVISACATAGLHIPFKHVSNSGAVRTAAACDFDAVRPGILLYGYPPGVEMGRRIATRPFLQWKTRLVQVKKAPPGFPVSYDSTHMTLDETHIGTIDVGYADGYSRHLSNKGFVIVEGMRKPVVGRVTMNLTMIDLGPCTGAKAGDEVVLLGEQGNEAIWADEMAGWRGTIAYEVLTNIRVGERRIKPA